MMTTVLSISAIGVLIALGVWVLGGLLLRIGGLVLFAAGLLNTVDAGSPWAALLAVFGAVVWLAGHWLFAARHHYYSSPLARRVSLQVLPSRLDPTKGWSFPPCPPISGSSRRFDRCW